MSSSSGQAGSSRQDPKGMDWMYKGPAALVDRDDYLTGRQVDKALNILNEAEKGNSYSYLDDVQKDLTPVSIFANPRTQGPIDVIRKIKEDPLYQIQKKEEENLRQLLNNPVKMKQLRDMAEQKKLSESKRTRKNKRPKKRVPSSSSSSSSSDDSANEEDIDKLLAEKLRAMKEGKDLLQGKKGEEDDRKKPSKRKYDERPESSSRSSDYQDRISKYDRDWNRSTSGHRERDDHRDSKHSKPTSSSGSSSAKRPEPEKKKIDESEKERRLREMMENAKWRDTQRSQNVNKQREEMKREEERLKKADKDADFIRKQLVQAADTGKSN
ncbi:unnamed protein product [Allacma fusca]|uniref:Pre-mRNA-splicing factor CWC25 n=1 Tax=Allacma fusca TaxID=39272 RepID=A0A8J2LPK9_9HEXA|nr:unnamed protein product [Allacma fusca]